MTSILVIDDEPHLVELVQGYLEREGYGVLTAGGGMSALELARSRRPDLVVLDVMLPDLDGIEVCRRLRQFSGVYVLMLPRPAEADRANGDGGPQVIRIVLETVDRGALPIREAVGPMRVPGLPADGTDADGSGESVTLVAAPTTKLAPLDTTLFDRYFPLDGEDGEDGGR